MTKSMDRIYNNVNSLTLDTHVFIWYMEGIKLDENQIRLIDKSRQNNSLYISAISIWEISMLSTKGKVVFSISLNEWINTALNTPGVNLINLTVPILIESCNLPNFVHKDPSDRMIVASTRAINSHLMTFDQKIIDYANLGYINVI